MELDKKALAVTRLVSVIFNWDPNLGSRLKNNREREAAIKQLVAQALPNEDTRKKTINMVLAMTLLTSGHVATTRNPEGYNEKKARTWATIISEPTMVFLKALGFATYQKITKQDYVNAKKLLPIIGSSSMLESEVRKVFQATKVSKDYPTISSITMDQDKYGDQGLGGFEFLYRGLSNMTENAIIRISDIGNTWDSSDGVSTSFDYRSAMGFATSGNTVLFSLKNPKRRGFNALKLSRYSGEKEVILSGVSRIDDYQLKFNATDPKGGDFFSDFTVEVTPEMIFIRKGNRPIYMKENLSSDVVLEFLKKALSFETIELEPSRPDYKGQKFQFVATKNTCRIQASGEIL
jgi:hypothetical protein